MALGLPTDPAPGKKSPTGAANLAQSGVQPAALHTSGIHHADGITFRQHLGWQVAAFAIL